MCVDRAGKHCPRALGDVGRGGGGGRILLSARSFPGPGGRRGRRRSTVRTRIRSGSAVFVRRDGAGVPDRKGHRHGGVLAVARDKTRRMGCELNAKRNNAKRDQGK